MGAKARGMLKKQDAINYEATMSAHCLLIEAIDKEVNVINLQIKKRIKCLFSKVNSDSSNMLNSS